MAPRNATSVVYESSEHDTLTRVEPIVTPETHEPKRPPQEIVWWNVIRLSVFHIGGLYGATLLPYAQYKTWIWTFLLYWASCLGITAGAHRLWAHRSYKAKTPLRIILAFLQTLAVQNHIIEWVRDHRVHHKYSETDADPHNAKRGFFFSHCGWLMVRKHPEVKVKGAQLDNSDVENDPVCAFQRRFYTPLSIAIGFVFPAVVPWYFWNESMWNAYFICSILRYIICLNVTWLVNSAAHMWGMKPYDHQINPAENLFVTIGAVGEGFHNYHHTFPQDYSTSEFGWRFNLTTLFIDFWATVGQVSFRKKMSKDLVAKRKNRTGDKSNGIKYGGIY